jgi:uncharacterized protein YbbK (DUF523 family)
LVSACLAGINCRYDGKNSENKFVMELVKQGKAIPVCPEQLGGAPTPRPCCEITVPANGDKKVFSKDGRNMTETFVKGAEKTLAIAKAEGVTKAILKSNSPSCGCGFVYDGTFTGTKIPGNGLTAQLLIDNGIEVITEKRVSAMKITAMLPQELDTDMRD